MRTIHELYQCYQANTPIACLTAYDALTARLMADAGVNALLVGDSLGMVIQGARDTLAVSVADVAYHTRCVRQGAPDTFLIADMPFLSYTDTASALANAGHLMQAGGADMVKLEVNSHHAEMVAALTHAGIGVCAHIGLRPQLARQTGRYRTHGKTEAEHAELMETARTMQKAGATALLLEATDAALARTIQASVDVICIGIGAGSGCAAQILVVQDVLGMVAKPPAFSKNFLPESKDGSIQGAFAAYVKAVKQRAFPAPSSRA